MDQLTFIQWHNSFTSNLDIRRHIPVWYDKCILSHNNICNYIGGDCIVYDVQTEDTQQAVDSVRFDSLINEICELFPKFFLYLISDGYTKDCLKIPVRNLGSHNVLKTSSIIRDLIKYGEPIGNKVTLLNNIISKMGEEWAKFKCCKDSFTIELRISPVDFANLGHYEADNDSCFRNGGENEHQKYILGQTKDTFILLVKRNNAIVSRFWGFASDNYQRWNLCNFYYVSKTHTGTILEAIGRFFAILLKCERNELNIKEDMNIVDSGVSHNKFGNISFSKNDITEHSVLATDIVPFRAYLSCKGCYKNYIPNNSNIIIENKICCPSCFASSKICSESKERILGNNCVLIYTDDGLIYVSTKFVNKYPVCRKCGNRSNIANMESDPERSGRFLCKKHALVPEMSVSF